MTQKGTQLVFAVYEIGYAVPVEDADERRGGLGQDTRHSSSSLYDTLRAFQQIRQALGVPYQTAEINAGRRTPHANAAAAAAHGLDETRGGKILNDFHEMILGDRESRRDLADRTQLALACAEKHHHSYPIVRVSG